MTVYNALHVAGYISHVAMKTDKPITHLQLQKVLYFLQAHWLIRKKTPLFSDKIEKWRLGPVTPTVYHEYKIFGARPISHIPVIFSLDDTDFSIKNEAFKPNMISESDKNEMDPIIKKLISYSGFYLVEATHKHDLWKKYENAIIAGEENLFYEDDEMREYFEENLEYLNICYE